MIEIALSPIIAFRTLPWLLVAFPAVFLLVSRVAWKGHWKIYAIANLLIASGISALVIDGIRRTNFRTNNPVLIENEMFVVLTNYGLVVLFILILLSSAIFGVLGQRSRSLSKRAV